MSEIAEFTRHLGHYLPAPDVALVSRAFEFSESAHRGQYRKSGEPYITHPLAVASILSQWRLDAQGLAAALLHDVMEDTSVTKGELEKKFGKPVADMVDGVSKLDQIEFDSREEAQAESFRKMLLAMARDVRVILIKLADRLHNMRTLDAMAQAHKKRIAKETLDIYAPIANRLGLNALYLELQDLCFKHLYPLRYRILAKAIKAARGNRREVMNRLLDVIREGFAKSDLIAVVTGREKTIFSVYKKMREKHYTFSQVFDIYGVRVLVADKTGCYAALGVLHELYKPIPGKFKDYVAIPKANGYQSLHTTLFGPFGTPLEVQIRTHDMHRVAEAGVAAHWLYKAGGELDLAEAQRETSRWLQSLLEIQSESGDSKEFLEHIKGDLFPDEIYVFTPKGKIMALPRGATAVDFAYGVHTDIGHHCVAARINYELLPLRTELKNGDHVEILTSPTARPNPSWLSFVVDRQGPVAHPPLPQGAAAEGIRGARRAPPQPGAGDAQGGAGVHHVGSLGGGREGIRQQDAYRNPGRYRSGQAPVVRRRAGADQDRRQVGRRAGRHQCQAGLADAARRRRRGDPICEVLPTDSRGRNRRPVPTRARTARARPRLRDAQEAAPRRRRTCRRGMGAGRPGDLRDRHAAAGIRPPRAARGSRHGHCRRRRQHRHGVHGATRRR